MALDCFVPRNDRSVSLRAKRGNPSLPTTAAWIASFLAMTEACHCERSVAIHGPWIASFLAMTSEIATALAASQWHWARHCEARSAVAIHAGR
jgi:hypothetical protein